MPDIRLVRNRGSRIWLWVGILIAASLLAWSSKYFLGDATERAGTRKVGASANFGADRAPVLPMQTEPFDGLKKLEARDLGRYLHVTGTAESAVRGNAVWVRTTGGRRILVRFEPAPPPGALRGLGPGSGVNVNGYLQKISTAEFKVWTEDSLRIFLPRPAPGVKFGDLPDSGFARVDSLFVKTFYISVRPEGLGSGRVTAPSQAARPVAPPASVRSTGTPARVTAPPADPALAPATVAAEAAQTTLPPVEPAPAESIPTVP